MTKEIREVWTAVYDENGQEQIVNFLGHAVIVPDPNKLESLGKIAELASLNKLTDVKIVKFTIREEIMTYRDGIAVP